MTFSKLPYITSTLRQHAHIMLLTYQALNKAWKHPHKPSSGIAFSGHGTTILPDAQAWVLGGCLFPSLLHTLSTFINILSYFLETFNLFPTIKKEKIIRSIFVKDGTKHASTLRHITLFYKTKKSLTITYFSLLWQLSSLKYIFHFSK